MKPDLIASYRQSFESVAHEHKGVECWSARDLQLLLGYEKWSNFTEVIAKAKESCKNSMQEPKYHFADVGKMIEVGKGVQRQVEDYLLTRFACYLIAQNGDPRIPEIAFAQMYFAMQTRKQEVLEKNIEEIERLVSRRKLGETEKEFAKTVYERGVDGRGIGEIKSAGDQALFGHSTQQMKRKYGMKYDKPLADVLPTVTIKAKDLATEMTTVNTKRKNLQGKGQIKFEHMKNNTGVRKALVENDIYPEALPPAEYIKLVESRHKKQKALASVKSSQSLTELQ